MVFLQEFWCVYWISDNRRRTSSVHRNVTDNTTPIGPCIVAAHAIGDVQNLSLKTVLNDKTMQDGTTAYDCLSTPVQSSASYHVILQEPAFYCEADGLLPQPGYDPRARKLDHDRHAKG